MLIAARVALVFVPKKFLLVLLVIAVLMIISLLFLMALDAQRRQPFLPFPSIDIASIDATAAREIPFEQIGVIIGVAENSPCGVPWNILAAVAKQESNFGRNQGMFTPHDGGILGYGQFSPPSWATYGAGGNIFSYQDALPAMARYLCALGVAQDPWTALMRYSGCWPCARTDNYANIVLTRALSYGAANTVPSLADKAITLEQIGAQWLSFPYRLGGNGLSRGDGIDCSALTQILYGKVGIKLNRTAQQQYDQVQKINARSAQPGDLLFFTSTYDAGTFITHVGMYEGIVDGAPRMLDASGSAVRYDNPFAGFWLQHLVSAGRPG